MSQRIDIRELNELIERNSGFITDLVEGLNRTIVGQKHLVNALLIGLLSDGHILLEGVPGLAKTLAVKTLSSLIDADFSRLQFTPDMLPADVTGTQVYSAKHENFSIKQGPVFANFILADEINRATPRTQSSLLECMEERQVSVDGETYKLEEPFFVIATQNPIETAGTFPLPEAQLDRFMLKISVGYPEMEQEKAIVDAYIKENPQEKLGAVCSKEEVLEAIDKVKEVFVHDCIKKYVLDIATKTRESKNIEMGISTRGVISMINAARAYAFVKGRDFVTADDIRYLSEFVFAHRIKTGFEAESDSKNILKVVLSQVEAPTEDWEK